MRSIVILVALSVAGCSSTLVARPHAVGKTKGIIVNSPAAFVITSVAQKVTPAGAPCGSPAVKHDFQNLPFGEQYEIDFDPGFFASNEFSVEFHESGALKLVSLNSNPQIDETIEATAHLVKEVGALAAAGAPAAPMGGGGAACPANAKDTEKIACVQRFEEWQKKINAGQAACP